LAIAYYDAMLICVFLILKEHCCFLSTYDNVWHQ
jgi:hypothetical protein